MKIAGIILALCAVVSLFVIYSSLYTVQEWEQVVVTQFGEPVGGPVDKAGLHWKIPFIQEVHRFEKRLLEFNGEAAQIPTRDKKFIYIDTFARWRITDPLLFFRRVENTRVAKTRLDDIIDSETRDVISSHVLIEAVRNSNRPFIEDTEVADATRSTRGLGVPSSPESEDPKEPDSAREEPSADAAQPEDGSSKQTTVIELGRNKLEAKILEGASEKVAKFGIELLDVRIKAINYDPRVEERVFERMISEREQVAERYRADGQKYFKDVQGRIERESERIMSEAYRRAETAKGEADAEAAGIYAEAYNLDPEFYAFWKSLTIYRESLQQNVSLVVGTDNEMFHRLLNPGDPPAGQGNTRGE